MKKLLISSFTKVPFLKRLFINKDGTLKNKLPLKQAVAIMIDEHYTMTLFIVSFIAYVMLVDFTFASKAIDFIAPLLGGI